MSRWEFMRRLEELLADISPNEKEEALQYYNDYFNDAGGENEQSVIESLGTPEQVAQIVKEGLNDNGNQGAFTEKGFSSGGASELKNEVIKRTGGEREANGEGSGTNRGDNAGKAEKTALPVWAIVLIVISCIIASPVILGLGCAVLGILVGIIAAIFAVLAGFGAVVIVLFAAAVMLIIGSFGVILLSPVNGVGMIAGGCICASVGILFMLLEVLLVGKCIPGICQGIAYIFRSIFRKREKA